MEKQVATLKQVPALCLLMVYAKARQQWKPSRGREGRRSRFSESPEVICPGDR
jgi:hypothetical protein